MEQNWLDLMPADVTNEITHQYARSVREDLHAELRAELLREIPGEGVWVDNPTSVSYTHLTLPPTPYV